MIDTIYAPLIVFVYNRKDKAEKVLSALNENHLAPNTDLYVFCDAYNEKKENDELKVKLVREYLYEFQKISKFKSININCAETHQGLAKSVISGITRIINEYGKVIVTEDDLIAHKNYLNYMNDCLNQYENNKQIWSISGYTHPLESIQNRDEVYFTYRGSSWGYATWSDRWNTVDWQMQDFHKLPFKIKRRHNLYLAGRDLWFMLWYQKRGLIDSWAVRWVFEQSRNKALTVYPAKTFLYNIGTDGSGTHNEKCGADIYDSLEDIPYKLTDIKLEKEILNEFAKDYKDPVFHKIQKY